MKKHWLIIVLATFMMVVLSACTSPIQYYNDYTTRTETITYTADNENDKYSFDAEKEYDGKPFNLVGAEYEVLEDNTPPSDTLVDLSGEAEKFVEGETFAIEDTQYQVVSVTTEILPLSFSEKVDPDLGAEESVSQTYKDESTGMETEVFFTLDRISDNEDKWTEAGTFPINIIGYGGPYYKIGDFTISSSNTLEDIESKAKAILEAEGIDSKTNRMSDVKWAGKTYKDKLGNTCRDVQVTYETNAEGTVAKYEGEAYRYTVEYIPLSAAPDRFTLQGTAHYKMSSKVFTRVLKVFLWIVLVIALLMVGYYIYTIFKNRQRGKNRILDGEEYFEDDF